MSLHPIFKINHQYFHSLNKAEEYREYLIKERYRARVERLLVYKEMYPLLGIGRVNRESDTWYCLTIPGINTKSDIKQNALDLCRAWNDWSGKESDLSDDHLQSFMDRLQLDTDEPRYLFEMITPKDDDVDFKSLKVLGGG